MGLSYINMTYQTPPHLNFACPQANVKQSLIGNKTLKLNKEKQTKISQSFRFLLMNFFTPQAHSKKNKKIK